MYEDILVVIPARSGSKGIPNKNIKMLNGKPLIEYSIKVARELVNDNQICLTTDSEEIANVARNLSLHVPFLRPKELATDNCGSNEVLQHALQFYMNDGFIPRVVLLLQPTSPFRKIEFVKEAINIYDNSLDMVASVKVASTNPYYNCYEEDINGFLSRSKKPDSPIMRRQDVPPVYEYNGSIYVINPSSLLKKGMNNFSKIKKYVMTDLYSVDLDTMFDWKIAELLLQDKMIEL